MSQLFFAARTLAFPMHVFYSYAAAAALAAALCGPAFAALADDLKEVTRLHHAGQSAAALDRADRYLGINPKDAQMRFLKSVVLGESGRRAEATTLLQQLVQEYPELPEPHNNLAAIYAAAGEYTKARAELDETLRLNPAYAPAHENLGDVQLMLAGQSYARALRLEPASASLPRKLALVRQLVSLPEAVAEASSSTAPSRAFHHFPLDHHGAFAMQSMFSRSVAAAAMAAAFALATPALAQKVKLATTEGDIVLELDAQKAPKSVANFVQYVKAGHYDGTVFHRVIPNFMIQGGGMSADMKEKATRAPIPLESGNGLDNERGTVAMARTSDPGSATAQFFINVKDNAFLNKAQSRDGNGYAVFGKVVKGMDVVDKIKATPTGAGDVPLSPIIIKTATLEK